MYMRSLLGAQMVASPKTEEDRLRLGHCDLDTQDPRYCQHDLLLRAHHGRGPFRLCGRGAGRAARAGGWRL